MLDREAWNERLSWESDAGLGQMWGWYKQNWFNWRGGLAAIIGCLLLLLLFKGTAVAVRATRWSAAKLRARTGRVQPVVEFYARLSQSPGMALAFASPDAARVRPGGGRSSAETPEFAALSTLPTTIVNMFYRVRFGGHPLDTSEAAKVEHALSLLESAKTSGRH